MQPEPQNYWPAGVDDVGQPPCPNPSEPHSHSSGRQNDAGMEGGEQEDLLEYQGGQEIGAVEGGFIQKRRNGGDDKAHVAVQTDIHKGASHGQLKQDKGHEEYTGNGKQTANIGGILAAALSLRHRQQQGYNLDSHG